MSIQSDAHIRYCEARNLYNTVCTTNFKELYTKATVEEQKDIAKWVWNLETMKIDSWILKQQTKNLDKLSLRSLRALGRRYGIKYYAIKTKEELLEEIRAKQDKRNTKGNA